MRLPRISPPRRGAVAPLAVIGLMVFVVVLAFVVDIGYIVGVRSELQNAADAAALAGASQLREGAVRYHLPGQTDQLGILYVTRTKAIAEAKKFAARNRAGNAPLVLLDSDIEFGYTTDGSPPQYWPESDPDYPIDAFPNTVRVTLRRDRTSPSGPLSLFFGALLGKGEVDVMASGSATAHAGVKVDGWKNDADLSLRMLPMTYDVADWDDFLAGNHPDAVMLSDDPALRVYPSHKDVGNFGQLSLDGHHAGAAEIKGWIRETIGQAEITSLQDLNLLPLSRHDSNEWDWMGNPGLKTSTIYELEPFEGEDFILPLFKAYKPHDDPRSYEAGRGEGSHYYYQIVRFVGVKMVQAHDQKVIIRPTGVVVDPGLTLFLSPHPAPAGEAGTSTATFFVPPKMTH
jgi:hypothetical protein